MISAAPARPEASVATDAWFTRSKLLLLIAALVAVAAGVVLFAGDRRLVAVTIGVWGVAAALTVHPVLGYIGWRVQQGVEADAAPSQGPDGVDRA
jgi:hypothetical protein